jgi:O-antigen/teichoic acid export membrane protein
MAGLSLRRNFVWTIAGNVVYALCLWAQLALLTKLGAPENVGRFALASAVATPAFTFAHLQLRAVLATDARGAYEFRDYLGVRLVLMLPALSVVAMVGILAYDRAQLAAIVLFACGRAIEAISDIYYGFQQLHERLDLVASSMMTKGLVALAAFGGAFALTGSLNLALAANALAWLVPLLALDIPRSRRLAQSIGGVDVRPRWRWSIARPLMMLALPMGAVMLAVQMRITIPRALLEAHSGERELGIFAALAYLAVAGATVVASLSQASLARFGQYCADGRADLVRRLTVRLLAMGLFLGAAGVLVAWLAGEFLLRLLYADEYAGQGRLLVLVMADGGVMYLGSLLGAPATAMKIFRGQLVVHGTCAVILAAAGLLLIPRLGLPGAALSMLAGSLWVTAGYVWLVGRGLRKMQALTAGGED